MNALRLRTNTAISIVALSAVWLIFSLAKGRLDLVPLAYGGSAIPLLVSERENSRVSVYCLNLLAGACACVFLTVFAVFGATLDGPITSTFGRSLVVLISLWGLANIAALICSGQMDGSWSQLLKRAATAGPATQEHDRKKPSLGLSLLASAQFCFAGLVLGWFGLLLVTWFFSVGFSPNPTWEVDLGTAQPYVVIALIGLPAITAVFAVVSGLGYLVRSRSYGLCLGHVFVMTFFLSLVAITRGWQCQPNVLSVGAALSAGVLILLDFCCRKSFNGTGRGMGRWLRATGLLGLYALAVLFLVLFARCLSVPTILEVKREAQELYDCIANMKKIHEAKSAVMQDSGERYRAGDSIPEDLVNAKLPGGPAALKCPKGGRYTIGPALRNPECSVHGKETDATRRKDSI